MTHINKTLPLFCAAGILALFLFCILENRIGLLHGIHRVPEPDDDCKWTRNAAESGDVASMSTLGIKLCEESVLKTTIEEQEKMKKEGLMWLQKAAANGDEMAINALKLFGQ